MVVSESVILDMARQPAYEHTLAVLQGAGVEVTSEDPPHRFTFRVQCPSWQMIGTLNLEGNLVTSSISADKTNSFFHLGVTRASFAKLSLWPLVLIGFFFLLYLGFPVLRSPLWLLFFWGACETYVWWTIGVALPREVCGQLVRAIKTVPERTDDQERN
ncbi:MAG: hypothetical protein AB7G75_32500 [Candidatus Binatia bacterium]